MNEESFFAGATRKQLRSMLNAGNERPGGGAFTKPSPAARKATSRRKSAVAKQARKVNR